MQTLKTLHICSAGSGKSRTNIPSCFCPRVWPTSTPSSWTSAVGTRRSPWASLRARTFWWDHIWPDGAATHLWWLILHNIDVKPLALRCSVWRWNKTVFLQVYKSLWSETRDVIVFCSLRHFFGGGSCCCLVWIRIKLIEDSWYYSEKVFVFSHRESALTQMNSYGTWSLSERLSPKGWWSSAGATITTTTKTEGS